MCQVSSDSWLITSWAGVGAGHAESVLFEPNAVKLALNTRLTADMQAFHESAKKSSLVCIWKISQTKAGHCKLMAIHMHVPINFYITAASCPHVQRSIPYAVADVLQFVQSVALNTLMKTVQKNPVPLPPLNTHCVLLLPILLQLITE